jgi:outer membrane receptor protein involved in Fe transport
MDNSSRNIVNFIATITVAALVLMAANYYAQTQDTAAPAVEAAPVPATNSEELSEEEIPSDETSDADEEIRASDTEVIVEDPEAISGNPSANVPEY